MKTKKKGDKQHKKNVLSRIGGFFKRIFARLGSFYITLKKENLPKLVLFALCIVLIGGTLVFFVEWSTSRDGMFRQVTDGLWWTIVTMTTVGYGDKYPVTAPGRIFAVIIMLIGVVVTSILSGTIASIFVDRKIKEGRGLQDVMLKEHIVICGWNRNSPAILDGLKRLSGKRELAVVLINEMAPEEFQLLVTQHPKMDLRFVRGDFTNEAVLIRAGIEQARSAIVCSDTSGQKTLDNADERTILAVLAIKSSKQDILTSAELTNPENEPHLKRANVDEILINGEYNGFLFANSTYTRGIPLLVKELLTFEGKNTIKLEKIPPSYIGRTFVDLIGYFLKERKGILIGLLVEEKKISFDDLLSDDTSVIDRFIKGKFAEADIDLKQEEGKEEYILLNPSPERIISVSDSAFLIGAFEEA
jgi:voltage-gated potassium channel